MTEYQERCLQNLKTATDVIKKCIAGKPGQVAESNYGNAYQACVKAGLRPQVRSRYRGIKR